MGFEPTVAINYDSFQDCSVRPLRHASVCPSLEQKPPAVDPRNLMPKLDGVVRKQNALECGEHLGHTVILDRGGNRGCGSLDLIRALTHGER